MSSQQNTVLDLKKPIRSIRHRDRKMRYVTTLEGAVHNIAVAVDRDGVESIYTYEAAELENIPQSRWLNVYVSGVRLIVWHKTKEEADSIAALDRVAIIEDKQDGSPWIVHQLEK